MRDKAHATDELAGTIVEASPLCDRVMQATDDAVDQLLDERLEPGMLTTLLGEAVETHITSVGEIVRRFERRLRAGL